MLSDPVFVSADAKPIDIVGIKDGYKVTFPKDKIKQFILALRDPAKYKLFLSVSFNSIGEVPFKHYDTDSPCTFRVSLSKKVKLIHRQATDFNGNKTTRRIYQTIGYKIERHKIWGEIPDHRWYSEYFPDEYSFPWGEYDKRILGSKYKPKDKS